MGKSYKDYDDDYGNVKQDFRKFRKEKAKKKTEYIDESEPSNNRLQYRTDKLMDK